MTIRPNLRALLVRELDRVDFQRRALVAAIATLAPEAKRAAKSRPSPAAARRPAFRPHKGSRKLRADVYRATVDLIRQADGAIAKRAIRHGLRSRGLPVTSVDYHLIRAVKHGDVKRNGSGYLARKD